MGGGRHIRLGLHIRLRYHSFTVAKMDLLWGYRAKRRCLQADMIETMHCLIMMIIIIIVIISFMQGIYTYIPETNYVPREHSVAAILLLLFMVLISSVSVLNVLYFYISTFRSMCVVPSMAVFCSFLTSCFPGMLLTYFLNDFEIVPVASIITGITFVSTFHMRCISIVRSLHFRSSRLLF